MDVVLVDITCFEGRDERPGVPRDPGPEVRDVRRPRDRLGVELALLRVILSHRRDVRAVLEDRPVEDGFAGRGRGDDHVGPLDGGGGGRHRRYRRVELLVQLRGERLAVLGSRRIHLDPVEVPHRDGRADLAPGLGAAADDREVRGVRTSERVDTDRADRARLEGVHARPVEEGQRRARLGVEYRKGEVSVLGPEARCVGVSTHRARLRENREVARQHASGVLVEQRRAWLCRGALAPLVVSLTDRVDVLGGRPQVGDVVAREKQRGRISCHVSVFARPGLNPCGGVEGS